MDGHLTFKILENAGIVIFLLDIKTQQILWTNGYYSAFLEFDEKELPIGDKEFTERFLHSDDKHLLKNRNDFFLKGDNESWTGMYRLKHKNGHYAWVCSKVSVFEKDENCKPKTLIGIVIDANTFMDTGQQFDNYSKEQKRKKFKNLLDKLTQRELEILPMIAEGKSYTKIAALLSIQPDTVNHHRKNILLKLNLNNVPQLVCFAKETGLV